jgi:riboflavin transporter FmnP
MDPKKGESKMNKKRITVRTYVLIGMLSSLAYVLSLIKFPLPTFPTFLKLDFSDVPALIAALVLGPVAGILVELIKNIVDYMITGSDTGIPVGHFANFIAGISFILPTYFIYNKIKTKKGMIVGLVSSVLITSVALSLFNYFVLLPAYMTIMGWGDMSSVELRQFVVSFILPFNLIKGVIVSTLFMLVFIKMNSWINKQMKIKSA